MAVTSNIQVGSPASIPTPPAGEATLFINTDDANILYVKFSDSTYLPYSSSNMSECCSCEISKKFAEDLSCALKSGMITAAEYTNLVNIGFKVVSTETNDGEGNKSCTVEMGPQTANIAPEDLDIIPANNTVGIAATLQLYPQFTPANTTNQNVVWTSSDPTKATVDQDGLVTGVGAGTTTITVYSVEDMTVLATRVITVS